MNWGAGESVAGQGNGRGGQTGHWAKLSVPPDSCDITLGGSVKVCSEAEDSPVTALAQPPVLSPLVLAVRASQ